MINKFLITGDLHGRAGLNRFENIKDQLNENVGVILLGDCGFNFYLNNTDKKMKEQAEKYGCYFYCVRGNHEARPEDIPTIKFVYDYAVQNNVYIESEYPHIHYLIDGESYTFGKYQALVIGGAYSVDKHYRLMRANLTEETNNPKVSGWFANEQLTMAEMAKIHSIHDGQSFDFIFTHTCPISIEPFDLFLNSINQNTIDKNMEYFLEEVKERINFKVWCFGHFHCDRLERPYFEQYYKDIDDLDTIMERWHKYNTTGELDWWLSKSPQFYWR